MIWKPTQTLAQNHLFVSPPAATHKTNEKILLGSQNKCVPVGRWTVSDPRVPEADERLTCVIESLNGTWDRPFTTLERRCKDWWNPSRCSARRLERSGVAGTDGNAVPPAAAEVIALVMGATLLLAAAGETFMFNSLPIWVCPITLGLSISQQKTP